MNRYNEVRLLSLLLGALLTTLILIGITTGAQQAQGLTNAQAKHKIELRESGGNPYARNGRYCGSFQMPAACSHLGDKKWQSRRADRYVKARYGSWLRAWAFWQRHRWY